MRLISSPAVTFSRTIVDAAETTRFTSQAGGVLKTEDAAWSGHTVTNPYNGAGMKSGLVLLPREKRSIDGHLSTRRQGEVGAAPGAIAELSHWARQTTGISTNAVDYDAARRLYTVNSLAGAFSYA